MRETDALNKDEERINRRCLDQKRGKAFQTFCLSGVEQSTLYLNAMLSLLSENHYSVSFTPAGGTIHRRSATPGALSFLA
jgi:hypothetical protein